MSDTNSNVFKFGTDVYTDKEVLEGAIAELLSAHLATLGLDSVQCGEKALAVRVEVTVKTGNRGRPVGSKNAPKGTVRLEGTHYAAWMADGTTVYHNVKASRENVAKLFGPFNTREGCMYAIDHQTAHERPCAWEATPVAAAAE